MIKSVFILSIITLSSKAFTQIENLDETRMERMIAKDTNFLRSILDDSLVYIHSNGLIENKIDFIKSIQLNKIIYEKMEIQKKRCLGKTIDRKIFQGILDVKGKYEGNPFKVKLAYTSIYKRNKSKYKLIYWQSTKLKDTD